MFVYLRCGDRAVCKPAPPPKPTRKLLRELLRQNALILDLNRRIAEAICEPLVLIESPPGQQQSVDLP